MSHLWRRVIVQRAARGSIWGGTLKGQRKTFTSSSVNKEEYQTMATVKNNIIRALQAEPTFSKQAQKLNKQLLKYVPKSQDDLPTRKMKDSFDSAIVPLSVDLDLRDKYSTVLGNVRVGRLMEDLDLIAVWCCIKHISGGKPNYNEPFPYIIVTIRFDDISVSPTRSKTTSDIRLSGHVCWVGKTSLEVFVSMDQYANGKWNKVIRALALMAARDPINSGPAFVHPIEGETPEEKKLLEGGAERHKKRLKSIKESLLTNVPTSEELNLVHKLFLQTLDPTDAFLRNRILPPKCKWMHDASLSSYIFCHPEHRNIHNKVFGGFLIRQAVELAWGMAVTYGVKLPSLIHISDISFYSPVDVGALLKMHALVTYTEKRYLQVCVYAEAFSLRNVKGKSTNSFNFTYDMSAPIDQVYPSTYLDAMRYIDGRRHFLQVSTASVLEMQ